MKVPEGDPTNGIIEFIDDLFHQKIPLSAPPSQGQLPIPTAEAYRIPHTKATFMALVDALIPSTLGALDLQLDEHLLWTLNHYISFHYGGVTKRMPLSTPTAVMLDIAANHLILKGRVEDPLDYSVYPDGGAFAALAPKDRFRAISMLENLEVDLFQLPEPYQNNAGLIQNIVAALNQLVMFGYYSEWFSYGTTRLAAPEDRKLERHHFIWDLLKYPGPSHGYRDLRGFPIQKFNKEEV